MSDGSLVLLPLPCLQPTDQSGLTLLQTLHTLLQELETFLHTIHMQTHQTQSTTMCMSTNITNTESWGFPAQVNTLLKNASNVHCQAHRGHSLHIVLQLLDVVLEFLDFWLCGIQSILLDWPWQHETTENIISFVCCAILLLWHK